jgi:hypothetical protein
MNPTDRDSLQDQGRLWLRGALDAQALSALDAAFMPAGRPGARQQVDAVLRDILAPQSRIGTHLQALLPGATPVRALCFDKTPDQNWGVPWHQDRVIAVQARHEVPAYGNWSQKSGVWHCEPPAALFEAMLFVRLHLDPADAGNGAMEVALGSHRHRLIAAKDAARIAAACPTEICTAARGDVLILNMLILHRSKLATDQRPRRTYRVDMSATDLPAPLMWAR